MGGKEPSGEFGSNSKKTFCGLLNVWEGASRGLIPSFFALVPMGEIELIFLRNVP